MAVKQYVKGVVVVEFDFETLRYVYKSLDTFVQNKCRFFHLQIKDRKDSIVVTSGNYVRDFGIPVQRLYQITLMRVLIVSTTFLWLNSICLKIVDDYGVWNTRYEVIFDLVYLWHRQR